jgi:hypothetical protein
VRPRKAANSRAGERGHVAGRRRDRRRDDRADAGIVITRRALSSAFAAAASRLSIASIAAP